MPRLVECIEAAVLKGEISKELADDIKGRIVEHEQALARRSDVTPEQAGDMADELALKAHDEELRIRKRQQVLQLQAIERITEQVKKHPEGIGTGVMSLLVKDLGGKAGFSNIDNRTTAILAQLHAHFADGLDRFRSKNLGFSQDQAGIRAMVRELFGESSGDQSAAALAKLWGETAEIARERFNRAGGAIPRREDWGLPQYHDPVRVKQMPKDEWIGFITPLLDRSKMLDVDGRPMSAEALAKMLDTTYDTISTNGLADLIPGRAGGTKLGNRRRDHRVLNFLNADAWLKYHDKFGHQDIYTTLTDHLHGMAADIAKLEVLGPNPDAAFRFARDLAKKDGLEGVKLSFLDSVWDVVSGKANTPESVKMADFMRAVRSWLVSAKLGGAFLSSISDIAFLRQTAKFNGIPAMKVFRQQLKLFNPISASDRLAAVKMGLTADAWITRALAANRFTDVTGAGFSARAADFTMRASFLSAWTDAGRKAFGMEFSGFLADNFDRSFNRLPAPLQESFTRYGISPAEWDIVRRTSTLNHDGASYFSPENLMKRADLDESARVDLATKIQEMILTETDHAVPTPDARARAITTGLGARSGTIVGEIARSVSMFKSFPITIITNHLYRGALLHGTANKAAYLGSILVSTTVLGAIALQAKDLAKGKDPRDMADRRFWGSAFVQGGGAGIYGDFLFSDQNRFGRGIVSTAAGPVPSLVDDLSRFTLGNAQEFLAGKDSNIGAEFVRLLRSYTPGGSLWYTRLALDRAVFDQVQLLTDPKAFRHFRRNIDRQRNEFGQNYWWSPGDISPNREPEIETLAQGFQ